MIEQVRLRGSFVSEICGSERIPAVVVSGGLTLVMTDFVSMR